MVGSYVFRPRDAGEGAAQRKLPLNCFQNIILIVLPNFRIAEMKQ